MKSPAPIYGVGLFIKKGSGLEPSLTFPLRLTIPPRGFPAIGLFRRCGDRLPGSGDFRLPAWCPNLGNAHKNPSFLDSAVPGNDSIPLLLRLYSSRGFYTLKSGARETPVIRGSPRAAGMSETLLPPSLNWVRGVGFGDGDGGQEVTPPGKGHRMERWRLPDIPRPVTRGM